MDNLNKGAVLLKLSCELLWHSHRYFGLSSIVLQFIHLEYVSDQCIKCLVVASNLSRIVISDYFFLRISGLVLALKL